MGYSKIYYLGKINEVNEINCMTNMNLNRKVSFIWDDRVSESKFRCVAEIALLRWKDCRCYLESESLKSNTSKENLHGKNLI